MNIHEFQAKQLFAKFGIPVPKGKEIKNARAAEKWAAALDAPVYVVKAQIPAGGRGNAGGVKITKNKDFENRVELKSEACNSADPRLWHIFSEILSL